MKSVITVLMGSLLLASASVNAASEVCSNENFYFASTSIERGTQPPSGTVIGTIRIFLDGRPVISRDRREGEVLGPDYRLETLTPVVVLEQREDDVHRVGVSRATVALWLGSSGLPPREITRQAVVCETKRLRFPPP